MRLLFGLSLVLLVLLSCNVTSVARPAGSSAAGAQPRWACPTPTPLPFGPDGPVKSTRVITVDGVPQVENEWFAKWQQEYGELGDPAPAPTAYSRQGGPFFLGQLVNLGDGAADVQLQVRATDVQTGGMRLFLVETDWVVRRGPLALMPSRQLALSQVRRADGRQVAGSWLSDRAAAQLAGLPAQAGVVALSGQDGAPQRLQTPILAPDGEVTAAELRLDLASDAPGPRTPTPEGPESTPTVLAAASATAPVLVERGGFAVRFVAGRDPDCGQPGTWGAMYAVPAEAVVGPAVPPGSDPLVAFVESQLGRPYCWGGYGERACRGNPIVSFADACPANQALPCWDCAGLTWGAYRSIGVTIAAGAANQAIYPEVPVDQVQPGDILLFDTINAAGRSARITHAGLYVGDRDGDGRGDMIHAANYPAGVIAASNVLGNRYYRGALVKVVRPPRGGR